ncbi:uncharacterized protein LOC110649805 isoform X1 [Hevea brasiliensis]|uniref:uncharacterized protein LOC110649805 isoform X1 n=1 Tax=Hevea brasiliensis TaxID=3981 RepID=UPI0025E0FEFF|nr:uncharacterized protein LOC110649805 isoform X1 [Hevea brasiliensis]
MAPEPKRRKIEPPPLRRLIGDSFVDIVSSPAAKKTRDATSVPAPQTHRIDYRIQQAKNFAVAQAQQEGCTGNFRIFDSPFGNFLVPVIPTREELAE